jgi:integrase
MLFTLAVLTGGRRGELCGLRWIDVEGDSIRFRRSLYRAGEERGEKYTKTGREPRNSVAGAGMAILRDWQTRCEAAAETAEVELVDDALIVSTFPDGSRPVNPRRVAIPSSATSISSPLEGRMSKSWLDRWV